MIGKSYKQQLTQNEVVYDLEKRYFEIVFSVNFLKEVLSKNVKDFFTKMLKDTQSLITESTRTIPAEMREIINNNIKLYVKDCVYAVMFGTKDTEVSKINQVFHVKFALSAKVK